MKKTIFAALLAAVAFPTLAQTGPAASPAPKAAPAAAQAQARPATLPDADPAMWVVRDEDTTVYLFGTFHLLDGKADWFNDEVKEAFERSQELVFEIDMPDDPAKIQAAMQPLVMQYAVDQQGRKLSSRLTAEQNKTLNETMASLGAPAGAFDMFEPWFVAMTLAGVAGQKLGMNAENGAEAVLKRAANGRTMTLGSVETLEDQIKMLDSVPDDAQLEQLKEALDDLNSMNAMLPRMVAVWNSGDAEGMDRLLNEGLKDNAQLRRIMLGERNEKWAEWIDQRMDKPGTVFMAVGAGHLVGPDSVQSFLQQRNIPSQRVPNQTPNR